MREWLESKLLVIGGVVVAALVIALVAVSAHNRVQAAQIDTLQGSLDSASKQLAAASQTITELGDSIVVTDTVTLKASVLKEKVENTTKQIKESVDRLTQEREKNAIDDVGYHTGLSNSMWDAYCAATKDDSACASRDTNAGHTGN